MLLVGEENKIVPALPLTSFAGCTGKAVIDKPQYRPTVFSLVEMALEQASNAESSRAALREGLKFATLIMMAKVLSLLQPWATLAVMGLKTIETRSWGTIYRGPLLIHAGLRRSGKAVWAESELLQQHVPDFGALAFGAIVGEVQLRDVMRLGAMNMGVAAFEQQSLEEHAFSAAPARFAWIFSDAQLFEEPIPATGRLGLWEH